MLLLGNALLENDLGDHMISAYQNLVAQFRDSAGTRRIMKEQSKIRDNTKCVNLPIYGL